jgi:hypothetical protein
VVNLHVQVDHGFFAKFVSKLCIARTCSSFVLRIHSIFVHTLLYMLLISPLTHFTACEVSQIRVQDVFGKYFLRNHLTNSRFTKRKLRYACFIHVFRTPLRIRKNTAFSFYVKSTQFQLEVYVPQIIVLTPLPKIRCYVSPSHTISSILAHLSFRNYDPQFLFTVLLGICLNVSL